MLGVYAMNAAMFFLAVAFLIYVAVYQYKSRFDGADESKRLYRWSVTLTALAVVWIAVLSFGYDKSILTEGDRRSLGIIPRILFVAHIIVAIRALRFPHGEKVILSAALMGLAIFIYEVMSR